MGISKDDINRGWDINVKFIAIGHGADSTSHTSAGLRHNCTSHSVRAANNISTYHTNQSHSGYLTAAYPSAGPAVADADAQY